MIKIARNVCLVAMFFGVGACSSGEKPVDIGDSRTGDKLEDYAAHWEGYAEAYQFKDGSDKLRLTIDATGNGTLEIGDSPIAPPPKDPNVGYPPNAYMKVYPGELEPGILHAIKTATVEAKRIRFSVDPTAYEQDWCSMQTPYFIQSDSPNTPDMYSCTPYTQVVESAPGSNVCHYFSHTDGILSTEVDCDKGWLCTFGMCDCDAQGCRATHRSADSFPAFDAALDDAGDSLVGTMRRGGDAGITIRLHRL